MVDKEVKEFGALGILVNNAGITIPVPLLEFAEDDWDKIMGVNLKSCLLCVQAVGKVMVERKKGNIINISSTGAVLATPGAYCITKAAVAMLTKTMALELAPHKIRVNAIGPGWVKTNLTLSQSRGRDPEVIAKVVARTPLTLHMLWRLFS